MATYMVEIWGEFDAPYTMNEIEDVYEFLADEFQDIINSTKTWDDVFDPGYIVSFTEV